MCGTCHEATEQEYDGEYLPHDVTRVRSIDYRYPSTKKKQNAISRVLSTATASQK